VRPDEEVVLHVGAVAGGRDPPVAQHGPDLLLVVAPRLGEVGPPRLDDGSFLPLGSAGRRLGPLPAQAGHDGGELGVHLGVGEGEAEVLQPLELLELQLRHAPPAPPPSRRPPPRLGPPRLRRGGHRAVLPGEDGLQPRAVVVGDPERLEALMLERRGLVAPRPPVPRPRRGAAGGRNSCRRLLLIHRQRRRREEHAAAEPEGVVQRHGLLRRRRSSGCLHLHPLHLGRAKGRAVAAAFLYTALVLCLVYVVSERPFSRSGGQKNHDFPAFSILVF
jgi:hypothetical protein